MCSLVARRTRPTRRKRLFCSDKCTCGSRRLKEIVLTRLVSAQVVTSDDEPDRENRINLFTGQVSVFPPMTLLRHIKNI